MSKIRLVFLLAIGLALALVVVQNTAPVQVRFLWLTAEVPAVVLLLLTAAGGFVAGLLAAFLATGRGKTTGG